MDEYIKRSEAIKAIENDLPDVVYYRKEDAIACLECLPTADVVPRSEYDNLKFQFDALDRECDRLEKQESSRYDAIVEAKTELAREIFEEMEISILKEGYIPYTSTDGNLIVIKSKSLCVNPEDWYNFKKRYTEEKQ